MSNITHPLDTALPMEIEATKAALDRIDEIIQSAIKSQDPTEIINFGLGLRMASQISGLALAKLLYEGRKHWDHFRSDDDFATIAKTQMGISDQTYNKYLWVWEHVVLSPYLRDNPDLQVQIMGKPIGGLILLTAASREGQLSEEDWSDIASAPDVRSIRDIVARVRGHIGPAKHTLRLWVQNDGTMYGRLGPDDYSVVGFVHRDGTPLSEAVEARLESAGFVLEARE